VEATPQMHIAHSFLFMCMTLYVSAVTLTFPNSTTLTYASVQIHLPGKLINLDETIPNYATTKE
jgi:hypothetical protein